MKKIYSLLLLGGLLLFGAESAWGSRTVYFLNNDSWSEVYCHNWEAANTSNTTTWHGQKMSKIGTFGTKDLYVVTIENDSRDKCIFNDGSSNQKAECSIVANQYYDNGTWKEFEHYYIAHDWNSEAASFEEMTDNSDGTYSYLGVLGVGGAKIIDTDGALYEIENSSIGNIGDFSAGDLCIFTFNTDGNTVSISAQPTHTVSVYFDASEKLYIYAWTYYKGTDLKHAGAWKGTKVTEQVSYYGTTLYKYEISVYDGLGFNIIFSNETKQTPDIYADPITQDATLYYAISDGDPKLTVAYAAYLKGTFNDWEGVNAFVNNIAAVNLTAGENYKFKVVNNGTWLGKTSTTLTQDNISVSGLSTGDGDTYNVTITPTITGTYAFVWNGTDKVTVIYPQITRTTAVGSYGTICVPKDATITGANLYTLTSVGPSSVVITPTNSSDLDAGVPYVYKATSSSQTITLSGDDITLTPSAVNGLTGVFDKGTITTGKYFLANDLIYQAGTGCTIGSHRAYFDIEVPAAAAPSAFRIVEGENGATSIDAIEASEKAVKFIENGQLLIKKNGVVYDMMGAIVK